MKFSKLKTAFAALIMWISTMAVSASAATVNPDFSINVDSISLDVIQNMELRTGFLSFIRRCVFKFICLLGKLIDGLEEALDTIMSINLYSVMSKYIQIDGFTMPITWAVISLAMIISAIIIVKNAEKSKVSEFFINMTASIMLIIAIPAIFSAGEDLVRLGKKDLWAIPVSEAATEDRTMGEQLISSSVMAVYASLYGDTIYYSNTDDYATRSVYNLNINAVIDNDSWNLFPIGIADGGVPIRKYEDLTRADEFELLGISEWWYSKLYTGDVTVYDETAYGISTEGRPLYHSTTYNERDFEKLIISKIAFAPKVVEAGLYQEVLACPSVKKALDVAEPIINELNTIYNETRQSNSTDADIANQYKWRTILTESEYNEMPWYERLSASICSLGNPIEYIYAYSFPAVELIAILIIITICLAFCCIRIASMLFDIVFIQIVAPIVVATDVNGSGRAKKTLQEIISLFVVFISVILVIKMYMITMIWAINDLDNIAVKIMIIIAGVKFVVGGPDFIVKIMGIDAGVKGGYGSFMAAVGAASAGTAIAGSAAKKVLHVPRTIGGLAGGIRGTFSNGIKGSLKNIRHATATSDAFKRNKARFSTQSNLDLQPSSQSANTQPPKKEKKERTSASKSKEKKERTSASKSDAGQGNAIRHTAERPPRQDDN